MTHVSQFDQAKSEAFAETFTRALNHGALCLMASLGHRSGLFDTMATMPPADSAGIAARAGLNERYVREWLGAMVTSGVVEHDPDAGTYHLPAEHAAWLTRAAAPNTLSVFAQYIPLLGSVEDDILACFRDGGGVPYARFGRFHEVMAEDSGQSVLPALNESILPLVPGLVQRLETGIRVLDAGCGRGRALLQLAETFPASRFIGYDLSREALDHARMEAERRSLDNVTFVERDLSDFDRRPDEAAYDLVVTFDAIHDQAAPAALLRGIRRSLADGGVYMAQDINASRHVHHNIDHPIGPLIYTVSCMHCMTVSLAQGGAGLGAAWGRETATRMMQDAGFTRVEVHELPHDIQNCYYVCRP